MKKLLLLFVGTTILFAFSGCAKDEEPTPPKKSNEEILVSRTWKVSAFTVSPAYDWNDDGILITDIYSTYDPCDKDDFFTFNANKTYILDQGPTKCNSSEPQTYTGFWSLNSDQTLLNMDGLAWTIKSMNASQMVLETTWVENGKTYIFTETYSKK